MNTYEHGGKTYKAWSAMQCTQQQAHSPHVWDGHHVIYGPYFCEGVGAVTSEPERVNPPEPRRRRHIFARYGAQIIQDPPPPDAEPPVGLVEPLRDVHTYGRRFVAQHGSDEGPHIVCWGLLMPGDPRPLRFATEAEAQEQAEPGDEIVVRINGEWWQRVKQARGITEEEFQEHRRRLRGRG